MKATVVKCLLSAAVMAAFAGPVAVQARPATMDTPAASALNKADQKIVMDMARANMAEIEAAKLAVSKTQNADVKAFAQQMIDDHTKALNDVTQLAQDKGVTLPAEPGSKHKALVAKLSKMEGETFDRAYMAQAGVSDHTKVHAMLARDQARANDPDVKALAAKMLPAVDQHLNTAKTMPGMQGGGKSKKEPVVGEANDHTSPGATKQGTPKEKPQIGTGGAGKPPVVGEANDHTSPGAMKKPEPRAKPMDAKPAVAGTKPPVTGEANEQTQNAAAKQ